MRSRPSVTALRVRIVCQEEGCDQVQRQAPIVAPITSVLPLLSAIRQNDREKDREVCHSVGDVHTPLLW